MYLRSLRTIKQPVEQLLSSNRRFFYTSRYNTSTHTVWYTNQIILYAYTVFVLEPFNYRVEIAAIYNYKI